METRTSTEISTRIRHGIARMDMSIASSTVTSDPQDGAMARKPVGETAECLRGKQRNMAAAATCTKDDLTTTIRTSKDGSSSADRLLMLMAALLSTSFSASGRVVGAMEMFHQLSHTLF